MGDAESVSERYATSTQDRRRETRWPTGEPVTVTVLNSEKVLKGHAVDVSDAGIRIRLEEPLQVREPVRVGFRDTSLFGTVRWCKQIDSDSQHAGVEIAVRV